MATYRLVDVLLLLCLVLRRKKRGDIVLEITDNEDMTYGIKLSGPDREHLDKCCEILQLPETTVLSFIFASGMKAITSLIYP